MGIKVSSDLVIVVVVRLFEGILASYYPDIFIVLRYNADMSSFRDRVLLLELLPLRLSIVSGEVSLRTIVIILLTFYPPFFSSYSEVYGVYICVVSYR